VLIPAAENSIAGNAFRPGDVLPSRNGMTVEIGNTDAEGRLVLADAISRAKSVNPEEIRKALVATNMPPEQLIMPWSGVKFDEKGQNTGVRAILQQVQKGQYATIYPFELAAADVVYPLAPWKDRK